MKYGKKPKHKFDIRKIKIPQEEDISVRELYEEMLRKRKKAKRR